VSAGKVEVSKVSRELNYADELVKPTYGKILRSLYHNSEW